MSSRLAIADAIEGRPKGPCERLERRLENVVGVGAADAAEREVGLQRRGEDRGPGERLREDGRLDLLDDFGDQEAVKKAQLRAAVR